MAFLVEQWLRFRPGVFLVFFIVFLFGWSGRSDYRTMAEIAPNLFNAPEQTALSGANPILFQKEGFSYSLTPLSDYRIVGLVVHRLDYDTWYSLSRTDKVFTTDLCLLWGESISNRSFENKTLSFDQDFRFCLYRYGKPPAPPNNALSNNHLIIVDPKIRKIADSILPGDQVSIKGKLVNVEAKASGEVKPHEFTQGNWTTSVTREDAGAGACEIIYVEDIDILVRANGLFRSAYDIGKYGMFAMVLISVAGFIRSVFFPKRKVYAKYDEHFGEKESGT